MGRGMGEGECEGSVYETTPKIQKIKRKREKACNEKKLEYMYRYPKNMHKRI